MNDQLVHRCGKPTTSGGICERRTSPGQFCVHHGGGDPQPDPPVWPQCSECHAPYILRRCHDLFNDVSRWLWQRDCKHKQAAAVVANAQGPIAELEAS